MSHKTIFNELLTELSALRGIAGSYDEGIADAIKVVEGVRDRENPKQEQKPPHRSALEMYDLFATIDVFGKVEALNEFIRILHNDDEIDLPKNSISLTIYADGDWSFATKPKDYTGGEYYLLPRDHDKALSRAKEIRNVTE